MRTKRRVSLLVVLALALPPALFSGRAEAAAQNSTAHHHRMHWLRAARHEVTGKVESLTVSRLTLACQVKGKEQDVSFALDPETQRQGALATGTQATVRFRVENNRKIATFVTAQDTPATSGKSEDGKH